jgi:hypothetical protein
MLLRECAFAVKVLRKYFTPTMEVVNVLNSSISREGVEGSSNFYIF